LACGTYWGSHGQRSSREDGDERELHLDGGLAQMTTVKERLGLGWAELIRSADRQIEERMAAFISLHA
jgi:hypothetical protein